MKIKTRSLLVLAGLCAGLLFVSLSGIGGCGTSGSAAPPIDIPSTASIASLSTVPSMDLSTLDMSAGSSSATLMVAKAKNLGEDLRAVGQASRAGCEANTHKDEIFRMSQMAQLDRCYPEAMEAAGLFTIGDGFAYYSLVPPDKTADDVEKTCDDIPEERTEDRAACESEQSGGPKTVQMRLGIIDDELQIDMCESGVLRNESTYAASGSTYTATVTRIGNFLGRSDGSTFTMTVDLGTTGAVTDGLVTLGDGNASASAQMNSRFGNGLMSFTAASSQNTVNGAFAGNYTDPFTEVTTSFTGKVHSEFAASNGCAKFSYTGSPPPMRVQDMIPFDISADRLSGFLRTLGLELGIAMTTDNYLTTNLCPNPLFDPEDFDETIKPMIATNDDGSCPSVTHTGVECFSISNGTSTTDYDSEEITQVFTTVANDSSSFYSTVNAFDLGTLDPTVNTVVLTRNWDCTGSFTNVVFESLTAEQKAALRPEMDKCRAIEEKALNREGMGGYQCQEKEQMNGVNDLSKEGPPDFGPYGGEYTRDVGDGTTCPAGLSLPERLFAKPVNVSTGQYCLPMDGSCHPFQVIGPPPIASGLTIHLPGDLIAITDLQYNQPDPAIPASSLLVSYSGEVLAPLGGWCYQYYSIQRPTFEAPPEFGTGDGPPQACIDLFGADVTEEECRDFCSSPEGREDCAVL